MITREQLKAEIDLVDETQIEVLHKIIRALIKPVSQSPDEIQTTQTDLLKGSVTFEKDILSPIDEQWSADH